jgi:glycosyltransferase involved in cell wall biosynthesis
MKIALIGPGIMPIPPVGWGAVEILIWEYYNGLTKLGNDVHIINTPNTTEIIQIVNSGNFDVVHLHYDVFYHILDKINCKKILMTSYYPYINNMDKIISENFTPIFNYMVSQNSHKIQCLSQEIYDFLISYGANKEKLFVLPNGANDEKFKFVIKPNKSDRAIYLGKIEPRKKQYVYQNVENIDFAGDLCDDNFNAYNENYLGKWSKDVLYEIMTEYASLVLLSDGDACPLVCSEALIAGLGLVVSKSAIGDIDITKPYVTVIPDDKLFDIKYVKQEINKNIEISKTMRAEIREYGIKMFSWNNIFKKYIEILNNIKDT